MPNFRTFVDSIRVRSITRSFSHDRPSHLFFPPRITHSTSPGGCVEESGFVLKVVLVPAVVRERPEISSLDAASSFPPGTPKGKTGDGKGSKFPLWRV